MTPNLIHIEQDFGWFLGKFDNNQKHSHYALQLSIPLRGEIQLTINHSETTTEQALLIKPTTVHQLDSKHEHLLILLNPASTIGHFWNRLAGNSYSEIKSEPVQLIRKLAMEFLASIVSKKKITQNLNRILHSYDCNCDAFIHSGDKRIDKAILYLNQHHQRVVPLEEISDFCNLSSSRFIHLFKENTGLTYRRAQLWSKLMSALPLMQNKSMTEIAHQVGFADSAHFSRTFKENFGFSPKALLKLSQFVQV